SGTRRLFALLLLERNQVDRARESIAAITNPWTLISIRVDRRFDVVTEAAPAKFDIAAAARKWPAIARARSEQSPRSMWLVRNVIEALTDTGHAAEAVALADATIAAPEEAFDDSRRARLWIMNDRAD